ncbi:MAG: carbonic anhydrase family protein, partial [Candidatus Accumulibacter sp.]|nr:carbonic anhydrase family protein [Accumulibacter sp.]
MSQKPNPENPGMTAKILAAVLLAMLSATASAAWQTIATEQGRHIEIDRESIVTGQDGFLTARGRIVLDRPVVDSKTSASYRIIEIESRYDCAARARTTLKRAYYTEDNSLLRQDEVQGSSELPLRSGTPDDLLLREVCRPRSDGHVAQSLGKTLGKVNELAADLRKNNEALVEQAVKKEMRQSRPSTGAPTRKPPSSSPPAGRRVTPPAEARHEPPFPAWAYAGAAGPEHWGRLGPDHAACAIGLRQSPIDLRNAFAVDLEPIQFLYPPASFRVADTGRHLQLTVYGGGIQMPGKNYRLTHLRFHNPSEFSIAGKFFDMEAQLVHRAEDGQLAIVSVLLEKGHENPVVQAALNNFPLEKGTESAPQGHDIDINLLLPANRGYFMFMGSLTTPPCTEDVLWMVIKEAQQVSAEQLAMFQRLYPPNAR